MVEKGNMQQTGGQMDLNVLMRPMISTSVREGLDLMNLDFPVTRDEIERKLSSGPGRQTFIELRVPLREVIRRIDSRSFNSEQDLERNIIETLPDVVTRHPVLRSGMQGGYPTGGEAWGGSYEPRRAEQTVGRY